MFGRRHTLDMPVMPMPMQCQHRASNHNGNDTLALSNSGYYNKVVKRLSRCLMSPSASEVCVVLRHTCHRLKPPHNVESISFIALARRLKAWFWWDLCGVVLSASQGVVSSCCCRIVRGVEKAKKGLGWAVQGVLLCWHRWGHLGYSGQ